MDPKILKFHIDVASATKKNKYITFNPKPQIFIKDDNTFNFEEWEKTINYLSTIDIEKLKISDSILLQSLVKSCPYDLLDISFKVTNTKGVISEYTQIQVGELPTNINIKYLFHGSPIANWYSIIRNGLVITSGTKMETNGSMYGTGIYLSDNLSMSISFTNCIDREDVIIGVFIVENAEQYKVGETHIYVVPDKNKVQLKYMIRTKYTKDDMLLIGNKLTTKYENNIKTLTSAMNAHNKRLLMGKKLLIKRINEEILFIGKVIPIKYRMTILNNINIETTLVNICISINDKNEIIVSWILTKDTNNINNTHVINIMGYIINKEPIGYIWNQINEKIKIL